MDRRRRLLVNIGEEETEAVLQSVAQKRDVRVFTKPRLADVLDIDGSGLPNDLYRCALTAHLDFVVAQRADSKALFAVEFDGPSRDNARVRRRDAMKDAICERLGLPLLRVDADFLQTVKGFRLLAWLVEVWFVAEAIADAQESGEVPPDEWLDHHSLIESDESGGIVFPYDLAADATAAIWRAYRERRCLAPVPNHYFRTTDDGGEAYAYLQVAADRWLTSGVRVRSFRFALVTPGELAGDLAVVAVATKLEEYERGTALAATAAEVEEITRRCKGWSGAFFGFSAGD